MRTRALDSFCAWLEQTPLSQAIQGAGWIVPTVQTIHILAIAAVMASALMIALRLDARFRRVIWWALPVLLATGAVMIVGEPVRSLENPVFQLKMALLVSAIVVFLLPFKSRIIATLSLSLWIGIVFAGRWIAYY
jgi:ABC-type transport system involved in cytochrome c biogenesis permease subunit